MLKESWYKRTELEGDSANPMVPVGYKFKTYARLGRLYMRDKEGVEWSWREEDVEDGYFVEDKEYKILNLLKKVDET